MTIAERIRAQAENLVYEARRLLAALPLAEQDRLLDWMEAEVAAIRRAGKVPETLHRQKPARRRGRL